MKRTSLLNKLIAGAMSVALTMLAPGFGCYEALAQVVSQGPVAAPIAAGQSGAAAASLGAVPAGLTNGPAAINLNLTGLAPAPVVGAIATPQATQARAQSAPNASRPAVAANVALPFGRPAASALPEEAAAGPLAGSEAADDGTRNLPPGHGKTAESSSLVRRIGRSVWALLKDQTSVALPAAEVGQMAAGQAREAGDHQMDRVLGIEAIGQSGSAVEGAAASEAPSGLMRAEVPGANGFQSPSYRTPASPAAPAGPAAPKSFGSRVARIAGSLAWVVAGAAVAIGAQAAAVALAPAIFGFIPGAALWAIMSGVVIGPAALYFRYRMSLRDSARLKGPKRLFDVSLGLLAGAVFVALPGILTGAAFLSPAVAVPLGIMGVGTLLSMVGGQSNLKTGLLAVGSTALLSASAAAFGPLTIGAVFGLLAMPALTTLSFYLGRIVDSAESGRPFSIPGSTQPIRFPLYTWVMTGVVFALLTGYSPLWTNIVFGAWMFLGSSKWFNYAYLGALAFAAFTGLTSPVTFLVIAFAPERAAVWTEALLGRLLKPGKPAPSSAAPDRGEKQANPDKWPTYHYALRTAAFIATLLGFGVFLGVGVVGVSSILINTAIAAGLAFVPLFFAKKLIKLMMKAEPTDETKDPEVFAIMKDLRDRINADRAAKGKKPIPMPEVVNIPTAAMPVPNAFATGFDPFHALVGVTEIFKGMVLEPETLRSGLIRVLDRVDPQKKQFKVFRLAISKSIPGVDPAAGPQAVIQAVRGATPEQLKHLGRRVMRGVLGHEMNHVMHRDMVLGAIAGAQASGISFASYGILWAVGHAKALARKVIDWARGRSSGGQARDGVTLRTADDGTRNLGEVRTNALDPVTAGVAVKTIAGLAKVFLALWSPIVAQLLQMASSRTREGHADEGGALLTEDPSSLALGLGLLMSWRPAPSFSFDRRRMPFIAALQHLFTVNPGEQLLEAGVLESKGRAEGRPVEKKDNAFLNLFITHPDTGERIEKLHDMALAIEAKKGARPNGAPGVASDGTRNLGGSRVAPRLPDSPARGEGDQASLSSTSPTQDAAFLTPPALAPPAAEPQVGAAAPLALDLQGERRGGLFRSAWRRVTGLLRVLPEKGRNREFWKFVFLQALLTIGQSFHYTALPGLIARRPEDASRLGANRAVNWGAQAASNLATGPLVDRDSTRGVLVGTHLGRAALMLAVPALFFAMGMGTISFPLIGAVPGFVAAFLVVIALHGLLQATSTTAATVGFNRILGTDTAHYNRANAVSSIVTSVAGVLAPLAAGAFIGAMDAKVGIDGAGNALSYLVYGALLGLATAGFALLKLPRDPTLQARRELKAWLTENPPEGPRVRGVAAREENGESVLLVEVRGDPAESKGIPRTFQDHKVVVVGQRRQLRELAEGFRILWSIRFMRLTILFTTLSTLATDSLIFTALPRYVGNLPAASQNAFTSLPVLGPLITSLTGGAGAFGLYLAAGSLGIALGTGWLALKTDRAVVERGKLAAAFAERLRAAKPELGAGQLAGARAALGQAISAVLERYVEVWKRDAGVTRTAAAFSTDIRAELSGVLAEQAGLARAEAQELADRLGLSKALGLWADRHFKRLAADARREARTGLDRLDRSGRATAGLLAAGSLLYWPVFFAGNLWMSVGAMLLLSILQGPSWVVWPGLYQRALMTRSPHDMGKAYSAFSFYNLAVAGVGVLLFGGLMAALPGVAAFWVVGAVMTVVAILQVIEMFVVFPSKR